MGIRQSFKHGTITIAEDGTKLPFDLGKKGTLFYHLKDMLTNESFRKNLKEAIVDCIDTPERPDSVVLETLGGRGSLFQIIRSEEVFRRILSLRSELNYNQETLSYVLKIATKNIEVRKAEKAGTPSSGSITFPVQRLRFSCIELLISNRYLDSSTVFYEAAEDYFNCISTVNDQLRIWETRESATEKYIVGQEKRYRQRFKAFEEALPAR